MALIVHWNCRGLMRNLGDIKDILNRFCPLALCVQETNLGLKNSNFLRQYKIARRDRDTIGRLSGGVAIIMQNNATSQEIQLQTALEAVAVSVVSFKTLTICSIYLPPHTQVTVRDMEELVEQLPKPFILVGDFNAHSSMWGSMTTDTRGQIIEDFIMTNDICILNTNAPTYCTPSTGKMSCLDLAFCSSDLYIHLNWEVHDNPYGSDHLPCLIHLTQPTPVPTKPQRWKLHLANWTLYSGYASLEKEYDECMSVDEINEKFTTCLLTAASKSIPQTSILVRKHRKPWWTEECRAAKKKQNKAWGVFRRYPTYENLVNFKQARSQARYIRKQAEKVSWQKYVSSINSSSPSKKVWEGVRKMNGDYTAYTIPLLTPPGVQTTIQDQADILGEHFAQISSSSNYKPAFLSYKTKIEKQKLPTKGGTKEEYNNLFTIDELQNALRMRKQTAPGLDNIHYAMIEHLSESAAYALLKFFNKVWVTGKIPLAWKKAIVIPFLKTGKPHTLPNSYRPIALTSCLAKSFESIVNVRLMFILEHRNLLDINQCGFRQTRSTLDHLVRLEHTIREAFIHKQQCLAVFFDLEKAYDTTWRFGILRDLADMGIRGRMLSCLSDFLADRTFQVRIGTTLSRTFTQENGVPQGCILSTTLFIVKMNSVAKVIPRSVEYSIYVDDLQIACRSSNINTCERQIQQTINKLSEWADKNGFRFSNEKTTTVLFSRKRRLQPDPNLQLNKQNLPVRKEHKFLGLTFDKSLSFIPHINALKAKANKSLNILKILSKKSWGSDRTCILHLYRSLVRSILDYGCAVYGSARPSYLRRLDPIHNHALRLATGAYRTSPVESIYVEANEPSLDDRRPMATYALKIRSLHLTLLRNAGTEFSIPINPPL